MQTVSIYKKENVDCLFVIVLNNCVIDKTVCIIYTVYYVVWVRGVGIPSTYLLPSKPFRLKRYAFEDPIFYVYDYSTFIVNNILFWSSKKHGTQG